MLWRRDLEGQPWRVPNFDFAIVPCTTLQQNAPENIVFAAVIAGSLKIGWRNQIAHVSSTRSSRSIEDQGGFRMLLLLSGSRKDLTNTRSSSFRDHMTPRPSRKNTHKRDGAKSRSTRHSSDRESYCPSVVGKSATRKTMPRGTSEASIGTELYSQEIYYRDNGAIGKRGIVTVDTMARKFRTD